MVLDMSAPFRSASESAGVVVEARVVRVDSPLSIQTFSVKEPSARRDCMATNNSAAARDSKATIVRHESQDDTATTTTYPPSEVTCEFRNPSVPSVRLSDCNESRVNNVDLSRPANPGNTNKSLLSSLDEWFLEGIEIVASDATPFRCSEHSDESDDSLNVERLTLTELVGDFGVSMFNPLNGVKEADLDRIRDELMRTDREGEDISAADIHKVGGMFALALFSPLDHQSFEALDGKKKERRSGLEMMTLAELVGDYGVSLFSPLHGIEEADLDRLREELQRTDGSDEPSAAEIYKHGGMFALALFSPLNQHPFEALDREDDRKMLTLVDVLGDFGVSLFSPLHGIEEADLDRLKEALQQTDRSDETANQAVSLDDILGSYGLALFSPLSHRSFEPLENDETEEEDSESDDKDELSIDLKPEPESVMDSCPRLLSIERLQEIASCLPASVQMMRWERAYSIQRDGDSFRTMLEKCRSFRNSVVVIETSKGHLLGGYAAAPWQSQDGQARAFYGTGQSFVFASHPERAPPPAQSKLHIYKWAGENTYCQMCDVEHGLIAMGGGGGDFGWIVEENFMKGFTNHCDTFANPSLIEDHGGSFDIYGFEIYGFRSLAELYSTTPVSYGR